MINTNLANPNIAMAQQNRTGQNNIPVNQSNGLPAQRSFANPRTGSFHPQSSQMQAQMQAQQSAQVGGQPLPQQALNQHIAPQSRPGMVNNQPGRPGYNANMPQMPQQPGLHQQARANIPPQGIPPQQLNPGLPPGVKPLVIGGRPPNMQPMPMAPRDPNAPPTFPPDVLSSLPYRDLTSLNEWSEKLKKEGKEVPAEVRIYEEIIKKDAKFLNNYSKQAMNRKRTVDGLVKDIKAYNDIKQLRMNAINLSAKNQFNNSIWGEGYQGYGNGVSNTATQLILPHYSRSHTRVPDIGLTDRQISDNILRRLNSGKSQHLVPIRLEFDQERDKFKLRDTFLWDLDEDILPLDNFVKTLIEDYKFIPDHHFYTILTSVNEQIKGYRKKPDKTMGELRIPIKVDVTINNTQLIDQFEWDILNFKDSDPEEFSLIMCEEMNLPGEFTTAITHTIREQTQLFHKALHLIGYSFDGSLIHEDEIRSRLLPSLRLISQDHKSGTVVDDFVSILRNPSNVADFTPSLVKLTQLEVERLDKEIERESRRKRRHTSNDFDTSAGFSSSSGNGGAPATTGRGTSSRRAALHAGRGTKVSIPDLSDVPKTFRTPAPSSILPGAIDLGVPDIYTYNEAIINRTVVKNPNYKPPSFNGSDDDEDTIHGANGRVKYLVDPLQQRLIVKIKLSRR